MIVVYFLTAVLGGIASALIFRKRPQPQSQPNIGMWLTLPGKVTDITGTITTPCRVQIIPLVDQRGEVVSLTGRTTIKGAPAAVWGTIYVQLVRLNGWMDQPVTTRDGDTLSIKMTIA